MHAGEDASVSGISDGYAAQIGVVLALAKGTSTITESIFENRFKYLDELARMGAVIKVEGNSATIEGVERFSGGKSERAGSSGRRGAVHRRAGG